MKYIQASSTAGKLLAMMKLQAMIELQSRVRVITKLLQGTFFAFDNAGKK